MCKEVGPARTEGARERRFSRAASSFNGNDQGRIRQFQRSVFPLSTESTAIRQAPLIPAKPNKMQLIG